MIEFLVKCVDSEEFDYPPGTRPFRPTTIPYRIAEGNDDWRIEVDGSSISISVEPPGVLISFEDKVTFERAHAIADEIKDRVEEVTGQRGKLLQISFD